MAPGPVGRLQPRNHSVVVRGGVVRGYQVIRDDVNQISLPEAGMLESLAELSTVPCRAEVLHVEDRRPTFTA